jgi:hypothetical protein
MTHGDKTKAKTVKSSKASGQQESSNEGVEARKAGAEKSNGKGPAAESEAGKGSKADKTGKTGKGSEAGQVEAGGKKSGAEKAAAATKGAVATKGSRPASAKEATEKPRGRGAAVVVVNSEGPFITNPVIAASFDRAVKKYPNAFRKLTD